MSSEIFYDKAFISVPGGYIPIANHGSSNCFDISWSGREVPEKHWSVLNYPDYGKMVFTAEEMQGVSEVYEAASTNNRGGTRKSRYRSFEEGEFGRWILAGMKSAHTVEEYQQYGNTVVLIDYSGEIWKKIPIFTTEDLLRRLEEYKGKTDFSIGFFDSRHVNHPPVRKKRNKAPYDFEQAPEFYVLRGKNGYFVKRSSRRFWTIKNENPHSQSVRKFKTEKEAQKYLEDNQRFFTACAFEIERVQNGRDPA